jgi:cytochrome P450
MAEDVKRVRFDPRDPSFREDPYSSYDALRQQCPIVFSTDEDAYVVTGHAEVREILADAKRISNERAAQSPFGDIRDLVTADDPAHRRHRKLISRAFTPKRVAEMAPYAEQVANELIDAFVAEGSCDIVEAFAYRFPVAMIAAMLGVPQEDHGKFRQWADDVFAVAADPSTLEQGAASLMEFAGYILAHGEAREAGLSSEESSRQDMLAALREPSEDGETLSDEEFVVATIQLLGAGHETTTNLIANSLYQLCTHPEERARLLRDPALVETAVEEILRFDPPVLYQWRRATENTEIAGSQVPAEAIIEVALAGANRDPAIWKDPDRMDFSRPLSEARQHLAFGIGPHVCLGAALARLEGAVALKTLLRRLPGLELDPDGPSVRANHQFLRGWRSLRVSWDVDAAVGVK